MPVNGFASTGTMGETELEEITLNGAETTVVRDALHHHEPRVTDSNEEKIDELSSELDHDLNEVENTEFEFLRSNVTVILLTFNEYWIIADERESG